MTNLTTEEVAELQQLLDLVKDSDALTAQVPMRIYKQRIETILAQQQEIERLRELVGDVLIDNHRHGFTTPKTLNEIQNYVSEGESDE